MGMLLTTSADHGLIIGAGRGCVKGRGRGEGEGEGRPDQPSKGDPAVFEKKSKEPPVSESSIPGH